VSEGLQLSRERFGVPSQEELLRRGGDERLEEGRHQVLDLGDPAGAEVSPDPLPAVGQQLGGLDKEGSQVGELDLSP